MNTNLLYATLCIVLGMHSQAYTFQTATAPDDGSPEFTIHQQQNRLTINVDGKLFARYDLKGTNKPILWPIIGPTGKPMTRAFPMDLLEEEKQSQRDHPHHRGVWFGHQSIGLEGWKYPDSPSDWETLANSKGQLVGGDSWHDESTYESYLKDSNQKSLGQRRRSTLARIKHRNILEIQTDSNQAIVAHVCDHVDHSGKRFLTEHRRLVFHANKNSRSIDIHQKFLAEDGTVDVGDRKDAGLSIRVPSIIAVDSNQGGKIINSHGDANADAWGKRAKWCHYFGPIDNEVVGIAFLNHPSSYRYPTRWHVREYGLFTANPFGAKAFSSQHQEATTKLQKGETLILRHRLIFQVDQTSKAEIETAWQAYADEELSDGF